jgi:stearoyl-CoA desaturase (delta-9 desaturase)
VTGGADDVAGGVTGEAGDGPPAGVTAEEADVPAASALTTTSAVAVASDTRRTVEGKTAKLPTKVATAGRGRGSGGASLPTGQCYSDYVPGYLFAVLVGLVVCQIAIFLTTIVLHRALSHKAITLAPRLMFVCRVLLWLTTGIRPRQWVAVHRRHHAFTDVEGDPHSPVVSGFKTVQFGNVVLYRRAANDGTTVDRYAKDMKTDRWDTVLFDHALLGLGIGVGILFLVFWGDWRLVALASAIHAVSYLLLNSAVNAIGHRFGKRPYLGLAGNSQWLAWLTAGEGLHSNHHAAPTSARLAFHKREIDPGWFVISLWRKLDWATVRHQEARIKETARRTPELV